MWPHSTVQRWTLLDIWTLREAMWLAWQAWCGEKTVRLRNCQIVSEGERDSGTGIPLTTQCLLDDLWDLISNHGWWRTDWKLQKLSNPIQAKLTPTLILTLRRSMSRPIWPTMKSSVWRWSQQVLFLFLTPEISRSASTCLTPRSRSSSLETTLVTSWGRWDSGIQNSLRDTSPWKAPWDKFHIPIYLFQPKYPHFGCFWPLLPTRLNFFGSKWLEKVSPI